MVLGIRFFVGDVVKRVGFDVVRGVKQ